jgi:hypothetical protein
MSDGQKVGFTEDEMFKKFTQQARYVGGDCYTINYMGKALYNSCTLKLREEWQSCFVKRKGRYFYN